MKQLLAANVAFLGTLQCDPSSEQYEQQSCRQKIGHQHCCRCGRRERLRLRPLLQQYACGDNRDHNQHDRAADFEKFYRLAITERIDDRADSAPEQRLFFYLVNHRRCCHYATVAPAT